MAKTCGVVECKSELLVWLITDKHGNAYTVCQDHFLRASSRVNAIW
jgi:hypothetical protein